MKKQTAKSKIENLLKLNFSREQILNSEELIAIKKQTIKWYLNKLKTNESN